MYNYWLWNYEWQKVTVAAKNKRQALKMIENIYYTDRRFIYEA